MPDGVEIDPDVLDGKPVIEGTQVPVEVVLRTRADGVSIEEVCDEFGLDREQVLDAIRYAADELAGEETSGYTGGGGQKFMLAEDIPSSCIEAFESNGLEAVNIRDEEPGTGLDRMHANNGGYILVTRDHSSMELDRGLVLLDIDT